MSTMKRRAAPTDAQYGSSVPKSADAVDQDTAGSYAEVNSLLFVPNRVLLRRVFFLDPDKTRYISVGYYPARNYQTLVEIGSPKVRPILLTDQHVKTLAKQLPAQVDALLGMVNSRCTLLRPTRQQYWLWVKRRIGRQYSSKCKNYAI